MQKLILFVLFSCIFTLRWITLPTDLPETWTPSSLVRFTAPIIPQLEHTDTKTIVRSGIWYVSIPGYAEIIPGDLVSFSGSVERKVLLNQTTKIIMEDPTFEVLVRRRDRHLSLIELILLTLLDWRVYSVSLLEKWLPEPMSSLAAGILLGVKGQMPSTFYQQLVNTGTLHIVAASGYNVSIVASVVIGMLSRVFSRGVVIACAIMSVVLYVLLSGASASVVRAGIMGSLTFIAFFFGRPAEAKRLLFVTAGMMTLFDPFMIQDVGFWLSVSATGGLLYIDPWMRLRFRGMHPFLVEYLSPTLSASLASAPILLAYFGQVSWISPIANLLVLPIIPMIMGMTTITLVLGFISSILGAKIALMLYVPLWFVVSVIRLLG